MNQTFIEVAEKFEKVESYKHRDKSLPVVCSFDSEKAVIVLRELQIARTYCESYQPN